MSQLVPEMRLVLTNSDSNSVASHACAIEALLPRATSRRLQTLNLQSPSLECRIRYSVALCRETVEVPATHHVGLHSSLYAVFPLT